MKTLLSPRDVAEVIGVSESSIKRWADSGCLRTTRTAGGHRRITLQETIRFIRERGFPLVRPERIGWDEVPANDSEDTPAARFHTALEAGSTRVAISTVVHEYLAGRSLADIIDHDMGPAMSGIGHIWQNDERGIYVEHRATDICTLALHRIRSLHTPEHDAPVAIGCSGEADMHSLSSLMAASVLTSEGWAVSDLSTSTPAHVLAAAAREQSARLVWIALSHSGTGTEPLLYVKAIASELERADEPAHLVVGGQASANMPWHKVPGVVHAESLSDLARLARELHPGTPTPSVATGE